MVWPNLFIVGAAKAGTTSLHEYLKNIPGIYMSRIKEPYYFSRITKPNHPNRKKFQEENDYLSLFSDVKDEKIIGESSASYLSDPEAPKLIHEKNPHAKIIISLRNPVERAYSQFLMNIGYGLSKTSFHEEIQKEIKNGTDYTQRNIGLDDGLYYIYVKRYLDIFGLNQVKILIFEEWIKNPKDTIKDILKFLGLKINLSNFDAKVFNPHREIRYPTPRGSIAKTLLKNENIKSVGKKIIPLSSRNFLKKNILMNTNETATIKPKMDEEEREILIKHYMEDVQKLKTILRDVPKLKTIVEHNFPWEEFKIKPQKIKTENPMLDKEGRI